MNEYQIYELKGRYLAARWAYIEAQKRKDTFEAMRVAQVLIKYYRALARVVGETTFLVWRDSINFQEVK